MKKRESVDTEFVKNECLNYEITDNDIKEYARAAPYIGITCYYDEIYNGVRVGNMPE
jgi:hypothetical protein